MAWLTDILVDSGNGLLSTDLMFSYIKEVYGHVAREQTSRACNLFCPISYLFLGINVYSDLTLINRSPHPTATSTRREMSRNVEKCRVLPILSKSLLQPHHQRLRRRKRSRNVEKCREMSRNVEKCRVLSNFVEFCRSRC